MAVDAAIDPVLGAGPPVRFPAGPTAGTGPRWLLPSLLVSGVAAVIVCLVVGGSVSVTPLAGLPDAGAGSLWALPVASLIGETAAVLALGAALLVTGLLPRRGDLRAIRRRCLVTASELAGLAAVATLAAFLLTVSDLTARPLPEALSLTSVADVAAFGPGRLLLISTALSGIGALVAAGAARRTTTNRDRSAALLAAALLAAVLIPWALGGHTTQSAADIAAPALIVHVLAAGAWIGGLTIVVLHVRSHLLVAVLPRFSTLALWCWSAIAVSGVIVGWLRLGQVSDLWTNGYGRLLLIKLAALGVLGTFGAWHRRRIAAGLHRQSIRERGALLRVAAVEVLVMGATMGVATALSATAPPVGHATGHDSVHGVSRIEAMAGHRVPVISGENLAILWRPDVIVVLLTAIALAGYLAGVRRCHLAGGIWPAHRTWSAVGAAILTTVALNSGIATYDGVVWSVLVTQQAITSMVIPLVIVLARPWLLIPAVRGGSIRRPIGALLARPWLVLIIYSAWTAAGLLSPLALWSASSHTVLMITRLADIALGTMLFAAVVRPVQQKQRSTSAASDTALLMAWFAVQAGLAGVLLAGGAVAARPWFTELNIAWITVAQDERTAALIHLGVAIGLLLIVAALPATPQATEKPPTRTFDTFARDFSPTPIPSAQESE